MQSIARSVNEFAQVLSAAGYASGTVDAWRAACPEGVADLHGDTLHFGEFWKRSAALLEQLPKRPARSAAQTELANRLCRLACATRERFLLTHLSAIYGALTEGMTRHVRAEELCYAAAASFPGLVPQRAEVAAEKHLLQRDKEGLEIDQGLFIAHVLADPAAGRHLLHSMLLARDDSLVMAAEFARSGRAELAGARIERHGKAAFVTLCNPRYLNAEDGSTLDGLETAIDLALLDPASEICVLRGDRVTHEKYAQRRVFGAGINLTHLYQGKIPFLWYLTRDLGLVNKLYRGLAGTDDPELELAGMSLDKLWIAAVDTFAIGGACQLLLTTDYNIAATDAYLTLPARKEGIIPGAANLRLPRFVGNRLARQAILFERRIDCDSAEGRLICDRIVAPAEIDAAIDAAIAGLTSSGVVSAAGNRRALRIAEEPLDAFRRYMSVYAREQAWCHFSPALIANLERNWDAKRRLP